MTQEKTNGGYGQEQSAGEKKRIQRPCGETCDLHWKKKSYRQCRWKMILYWEEKQERDVWG